MTQPQQTKTVYEVSRTFAQGSFVAVTVIVSVIVAATLAYVWWFI